MYRYLYFDVRLVQLYHLPVVLLGHSPALQENQLLKYSSKLRIRICIRS
jgi:hypothetical protein